MRAFLASKDSDLHLEEKVKLIDDYSTVDLLYVVREYEDTPSRFEEDVVKAVAKKLYKKGIMCV